MITTENIVRYISGTVPATFESSYDLNESVQRLSAIIDNEMHIMAFRTRVIGEADVNNVSLGSYEPTSRYSTPGNSDRFFIGSFRQIGDKVFLVGKFFMSFMLPTLILLWFGVFLVASAFWQLHQRFASISLLYLPLVSSAYLVLAILAIFISKMSWRADVSWLSAQIREALASPSVAE